MEIYRINIKGQNPVAEVLWEVSAGGIPVGSVIIAKGVDNFGHTWRFIVATGRTIRKPNEIETHISRLN